MFYKQKHLTIFIALAFVLFFVHASFANAATLYFNGAADSDWGNLANWWNDPAFTDQALALPSASDDVIVSAKVESNSDSDPTVNTLTVNGTIPNPLHNLNNISLDFGGLTITVTNGATFNGVTQTYHINLIGNATFNDYGLAEGTITGDVTFNDKSFTYFGVIDGTAKYSYAHGGVITVPDGGGWQNNATNNVGDDDVPITSWVFMGNSRNVSSTIDGDITDYDDFSGDYYLSGFTVVDVTGTRTRHYTKDTTITRDFTFDGPWTVVADNCVVNTYYATFDGTTTFQTIGSGSFVSTPITPSFPHGILYGVDGMDGYDTGEQNPNPAQLYKIDPETGIKMETIGPVGFSVTGLAFHPTTHVLYGVSSAAGEGDHEALITIDTTTGAGTLLGAMKDSGDNALDFSDISFRSDGRLYGWISLTTSPSLYTIDISSCDGTTCTATAVGGTVPFFGDDAGLAFDSLDHLYVFADDDGSFFQLNPDTGSFLQQKTIIRQGPGNIGFSALGGAAFDSADNLYVSRTPFGALPSDLSRIDINTGVLTTSVMSTNMQYMTSLAYLIMSTAPTVSVSAASAITTTSATLNGAIDTEGSSTPTTRGFHLGTDTSYGTTISETGTYSAGAFSLTRSSGLSCGTEYHYQTFATNTTGTGVSGDQLFTTSPCASSGGGSGGQLSGGGGGGSSSSAPVYTAPTPTQPSVPTTTPPTAPATNTPTLPATTPTLKQNATSAAVKTLQRLLNDLGFAVSSTGPGSKGKETTFFGPATKKALIKFQKAKGLVPDGILGPKTLKVLNALS